MIFIIIKEKKKYYEYISGKRLKEAFSDERIPLMTMDHLCALDFPISRNISYERTVDEFLIQLPGLPTKTIRSCGWKCRVCSRKARFPR